MELAIERIKIGKRVRVHMGDIKSLARSIAAVGLLHPIVVRAAAKGGGYELVAGHRRLEAWKTIHPRKPIPVTVVDLASIRRGEFAENHERKNFTPSELVDIKRQLEIEFDLKGEAQKRMHAGRGAKAGTEKGTVNDIVGAYAGRSGRTVKKAELVVEAAERDPQRFGTIKEEMDRTGKIDRAALRVRAIMSDLPTEIEDIKLCGQRMTKYTKGMARAYIRDAERLKELLEAADRHGQSDDWMRLVDCLPAHDLRRIK